VKVEEVRTMVVRGHLRRMGRGHEKTKNWKKAIVAVKDGDTIEFFEGA
jgi:large subunit ribosomal protein L23